MRRRSRAVDRLLVQLGDDDPKVRTAAIEAIERKQLDGDRRPRPSARQIDQVFRVLATLLRRDPEAGVRAMAAYALSFWFQPRAPAALIPVLEDASEQSSIRGQAAEGIGNVLGVYLGSRELRARAIAALRRGLADPAVEVRFWCVYALGCMSATEARAEIERLAASDDAVCPSMWRVRHEAEDVLTYWAQGEWPHRDTAPEARLLSRLGRADSASGLSDALVDAALLVESDAEAARTPELRAALHALAAHPEPKVVAATVFAVGKLPASAELVSLCRSTLARHLPNAGADDAAVVYQCLIALENMGEAIPWEDGSITAVDTNRRAAEGYLSK